jgi:hypothetical protein
VFGAEAMMSTPAYLSIVVAFAAVLLLGASFYRPEYGEMLSKVFSRKVPAGCRYSDYKMLICPP